MPAVRGTRNEPRTSRAGSRGVRFYARRRPGRSAPSCGAGCPAGHGIRPLCDHAVAAGVGFRQLPPAGRAAAAGHLGGAGAGLGGAADRAVALQVRHPAAVADVPRFPDHRSRYVLVPALGVSAVADAVDRGGLVAVPRVVADLARRSVPRRPPLRAGRLRRDDRVDVGDVGRGARAAVGAVPGRQSYFQPRALGRGGGVAADFDRMDRGRSACERPLPLARVRTPPARRRRRLARPATPR